MTVATMPKVYTILGEEFELDELKDVANHGANTGVSGFTYSSDLYDKFEKYEHEIMDALGEWCDDNFSQGAESYIAEQLSFDDKFWTMQQFKELACWMYLEMRAWFIVGEDS
tara:strand:+ start:2793 stop:3128 length:336 start_codon:yes stop_codon:yes gene_type:complete